MLTLPIVLTLLILLAMFKFLLLNKNEVIFQILDQDQKWLAEVKSVSDAKELKALGYSVFRQTTDANGFNHYKQI